MDTRLSRGSYDAAARAAGGVLAACDTVMVGRVANAFCAVRPPGHHARADRAAGYCLFNHVAVAAQHLVDTHGLTRIAVVDFDVHHGDGTQAMFESRRDVLFISMHAWPDTLWPHTGWPGESGSGAGAGYTLNVPMVDGADDAYYLDALDAKVLPALADYDPQFLLLSAGFDAAVAETIAKINLTPVGFGAITSTLVDVAGQHCAGRLVSVLEGGYDLPSLGRCVVEHLRGLTGKTP